MRTHTLILALATTSCFTSCASQTVNEAGPTLLSEAEIAPLRAQEEQILLRAEVGDQIDLKYLYPMSGTPHDFAMYRVPSGDMIRHVNVNKGKVVHVVLLDPNDLPEDRRRKAEQDRHNQLMSLKRGDQLPHITGLKIQYESDGRSVYGCQSMNVHFSFIVDSTTRQILSASRSYQ